MTSTSILSVFVLLSISFVMNPNTKLSNFYVAVAFPRPMSRDVTGRGVCWDGQDWRPGTSEETVRQASAQMALHERGRLNTENDEVRGLRGACYQLIIGNNLGKLKVNVVPSGWKIGVCKPKKIAILRRRSFKCAGVLSCSLGRKLIDFGFHANRLTQSEGIGCRGS